MTPPFLIWTSASRTDVGRVRKANEDACLDLPDLGLWAVADGMGGHHAGDVASAAIVEGLAALDPPGELDAFADAVRERLREVNRDLRERATREGVGTMGSTAVVLLAFGHRCAGVWAGDSRLYRLRDGTLTQITRDHSAVEEYVASGMSREEAESGPWSNAITRAVGADTDLDADTVFHDLADGDAFLLCSDGLYREVRDPEIEAALTRSDPRQACDRLVELALERGARDNVTVVAVRFHQPGT